MLRSAFLVFIAGWVVWFWADKPSAGQFRMPQVSDSMIENFQTAFNILKAGYLDMAFIYIWNAHYIILSLLGGAILAVAYGSVSDMLGRRRMRKNFFAARKSSESKTTEDKPPGSTPAE